VNKFKKHLYKTILFLTALLMAGYLVLIFYINLNKADIIKNITQTFESEINGHVTINNISISFFRNFPKISVLLNEVEITDQKVGNHHYPFFKGENVFVQLDALKLLQNQFIIKGIKIEHARFYVYTDSTGYTNGYLFKLKKESATEGFTKELNLKKLILKDVGLTIDDAEKKKLYDLFVNKLASRITDSDSSLLVNVHTGLIIKKLVFSEGGREILSDHKVEGNFELLYNKQSQELHTDSMELKVGGQPFNFNFTIDLKSPAPKFQLKVNKGSIPFADLKFFAKPAFKNNK
jgi:hypothetical protein